MRKYIVLLTILLITLSGCGVGNPSETAYYDILGKYICSNDYINGGEHFERFPEDIPAINFYEDGICEITINYLEGICIASGIYTIEESRIFVAINLDNTIFEGTGAEYIDDQYIFDIINDEQIVIDRDFYLAWAGDSFLKISE